LDELAQMDPREASEVAYLLANGIGKTRMSRNMGVRRSLSWSLLFVSAGELTLADHAQTVGKRIKGGAEVRLLNIEADAGGGMGIFEQTHGAESPEAFARQLKDAARRFYGAPLREWLACLTKGPSVVKAALRRLQAEFVKQHVPAAASGELSRAAFRLGLIAGAGELATSLGITGWQSGEAMNAAGRGLHSWTQGRGTTGPGDEEAAVNQVRKFIEVNGASRFQAIHSGAEEDSVNQDQFIPNRAGLRRKNRDGEDEFIIFREVFRTDVCQGFDYRMVAHALEQRGFLKRQPPDLTISVRISNFPDPRAFCIKASILEG
jgi:uncharacterized protein (DUF927 family)